MRKLLSCRDYDGLDIWRKAAVRISDGALRLEVYHIADSAHDVAYSKFMASVDCQIVIIYDADAFQALDSLTYDVNALVHVEESALVLVDADSDDDFVEHCQCPFKNIEMSRRKRIEGSREQSLNFHYTNNKLFRKYTSCRARLLQLPVDGSFSFRLEDFIGLGEMPAAEECATRQRRRVRRLQDMVPGSVDERLLAAREISPQKEDHTFAML